MFSQGSSKGSLQGGVGTVTALADWFPLKHALDAQLLVAVGAGVRAHLAVQFQTRILGNQWR